MARPQRVRWATAPAASRADRRPGHWWQAGTGATARATSARPGALRPPPGQAPQVGPPETPRLPERRGWAARERAALDFFRPPEAAQPCANAARQREGCPHTDVSPPSPLLADGPVVRAQPAS